MKPLENLASHNGYGIAPDKVKINYSLQKILKYIAQNLQHGSII
ncbi:hypothetical protein NIES4075_25660 [Tolypothrix sp. NIES-4075]|nr:hypothetical protein NIES4075_25660 [Tolypothrix sp. NIES-4075]